MKVVIDSEIPFTHGLFEPYGEVLYKPGRAICREDILDADAMIISLRTKCNSKLLRGTGVKIISTANIGTDHIDTKYCSEHGIFVQNAAGCNAGGVMNYVISALYASASRKGLHLEGATFGIIGAGSSGSALETAATTLGFKVLVCDPPRAEREGGIGFCSLDDLLANSDIVTLLVPLNETTENMADTAFFEKMKMGSVFINVSRGEVVDEEALIAASPKLGAIVIDTWRNEPDINIRLLNVADIATPHVAGYSLQGKTYASAYSVRAVARFFGIEELKEYLPPIDESQKAVRIESRGLSQGELASIIQYSYPIFTDDFMFRMMPGSFTQLRNDYSYRREFYIE